MVKYLVTKEIEIDDCVMESEDIGVFDNEEEAKAKIIEPYRTQEWKKKVVHDHEELWQD